jgi:hypothetical protein
MCCEDLQGNVAMKLDRISARNTAATAHGPSQNQATCSPLVAHTARGKRGDMRRDAAAPPLVFIGLQIGPGEQFALDGRNQRQGQLTGPHRTANRGPADLDGRVFSVSRSAGKAT